VNKPFGFLIIDKPAGITSHDCVNVIRKVFQTKRVGHGGTLDPAVTGVLPIAVGNATRLFKYLPGEKTYQAIIQLGKQTFTDDINGEVILEQKWPTVEEAFIENILNDFRGIIYQQPPLISSVHHQGERAYKKARKGETFELAEREITIYKLELCSWNQKKGQLQLKIHCSSGTYIRALARDLGKKLNCGGCLLKLRRIQAQGFPESRAIALPKIKDDIHSLPPLINPRDAISHLNQIQLKTKEQLDYWRKGQTLTIPEEFVKDLKIPKEIKQNDFSDHVAVIEASNQLAGIGLLSLPCAIKPKVVFNAYS
tara:strand:- start:3047 stop:3979 length:933 start_codon:yes stop_codon:yes gene_type:complete